MKLFCQSDFSVLPMALSDKDIVIALRVTSTPDATATSGKTVIRLANMDSKRFPMRVFTFGEEEISIDATKHEWSNYFLSGLKVL